MTDAAVNQVADATTSLRLLDRVRAKDQTAWERLVALYAPLVYDWCLRAGLQQADAADVGQEVFMAVNRGIATFRRDRPSDTFRGWLRTITRNKIRDHRAHRPGATGTGGSDAQRKLAEVPDVPDDDESANVLSDEALTFRRAIEMVRSEFEPITWDACWRVTVLGQMPADVATDLGISTNAVYLAKSRILQRLREEFDALVEFD